MNEQKEKDQGTKGTWLIKLYNIKLDKPLLVFLVFFGIATFLWFLAALEKDYTTTIEHPVLFTDLPEDKVVVSELPSKLKLEVEAAGLTLLRHNWDISKNPVEIKFSQLLRGKKNNQENFKLSIPSSQIKSRIANQLDNIAVIEVLPDSLHFLLSGSDRRKVPVISNISFVLEKQFMIRDKIEISPDSVVVIGPSVMLDTLSGIYTSSLRFRKLNHSLTRNLNLEIPNDQLRIETTKVIVDIPVEQFTEKKLTIPVDPINLPDSLNLKTFPASVEAIFRVVISAFDNIQPEGFKIVVDYFDIEAGNILKIKPNVLMAPSLIENLRIEPELVDYLLEQK